MIFNFLSSNLHVRIWKNRINVRDVERDIECEDIAIDPFTTSRLLIGTFTNADNLLMKLVKEVNRNRFSAFKPNIVMHQIEMVEDGLSQVEVRVLRELGSLFGSPKVMVHLGQELTDLEVLNMIKSYNKSLKHGTAQSAAP